MASQRRRSTVANPTVSTTAQSMARLIVMAMPKVSSSPANTR